MTKKESEGVIMSGLVGFSGPRRRCVRRVVEWTDLEIWSWRGV